MPFEGTVVATWRTNCKYNFGNCDPGGQIKSIFKWFFFFFFLTYSTASVSFNNYCPGHAAAANVGLWKFPFFLVELESGTATTVLCFTLRQTAVYGMSRPSQFIAKRERHMAFGEGHSGAQGT